MIEFEEVCNCVQQGDTLDYLGIPGLHIAGSQGVLVIAICQVLLMVCTLLNPVRHCYGRFRHNPIDPS
ncbi:hypothetical protein GIB67_033762 [Kingdonia uniflora]|uniref:Uncharacterized protein n=1 Tax=Kingdonia uniflora TaxID=39325 RepID=A0A7J7P4F9_9MAGN|nr:hypothetical protein GIB67_033762 [Kingdonia uniflora]